MDDGFRSALFKPHLNAPTNVPGTIIVYRWYVPTTFFSFLCVKDVINTPFYQIRRSVRGQLCQKIREELRSTTHRKGGYEKRGVSITPRGCLFLYGTSVGTNKDNETDGADRQSRKINGNVIGPEESTGNSTKDNDTYASIVTKNIRRPKRRSMDGQGPNKLILLSQSNS